MAVGRYTRIKSIFWHDEKTRLWDDEARYLALYLLTSPHNNILGCHVLPKLYICADLGWDMERLGKAFAKLLGDGFIKYDDANNLIFIVNYLKHNPIENPNQAKAAEKQLVELPKSPLLQDLKRSLKQFDKPFLEQLAKRIPEPVTVTVTVTETVTTTTPISPPNEESDSLDTVELPEPPEPKNSGRGDRKITDAFSKEYGRLLGPFEVEQIKEWEQDFPDDVILHALKTAVLANNRSFKYIGGILRRWRDAGVKSVQDVEELDRQFQAKKQHRARGQPRRPGDRPPVPEATNIFVPPGVLERLADN